MKQMTIIQFLVAINRANLRLKVHLTQSQVLVFEFVIPNYLGSKSLNNNSELIEEYRHRIYTRSIYLDIFDYRPLPHSVRVLWEITN